MKFHSEEELTATVRAADWLVEGIMERNAPVVLFGAPEAGKSFLALDWSLSITAGVDWLGHATKQGSVFYLLGEGQTGFPRRIAAWRQHHAIERALPLHVSEGVCDFRNPVELRQLIMDMCNTSLEAELVVIDTLARFAPGMNDENANEVLEFIAACSELQRLFRCAVLILHHSGHRDKDRMKGSIALPGALDCIYGFQPTNTALVSKLRCAKMKDGTKPPDMLLRFADVELPSGIKSAVLVECGPLPERAKKAPRYEPGANDKLLIAALGHEPKNKAAVRAAFMSAHPPQGNATRNWQRAFKRGLSHGWFAEDDSHRLTPNLEAIERDSVA